jgi:hypothetical protein
MGRIGVIGPGFEQQHGNTLVCSQSAGQHTPSRSPSDDYHVVFHGPSFNGIPPDSRSAMIIVMPFRWHRNLRGRIGRIAVS